MRFHTKFHNRNHHTSATPGYPDSGLDPIASKDAPFMGSFFISGSLSANGIIEGESLSANHIYIDDFTVPEINVTSLSSVSAILNDINSANIYSDVLTANSLNTTISEILTSNGDYLNYYRLSSQFADLDDISTQTLTANTIVADNYIGLVLSSLNDVTFNLPASAFSNNTILKYNTSLSSWENVELDELNYKKSVLLTSSYNISSDDIFTYVLSSSSAITATLPDTRDYPDLVLNIKYIGTNTLTVSAYANQPIDDSNVKLLGTYDNMTIHSQGVDERWFIL